MNAVSSFAVSGVGLLTPPADAPAGGWFDYKRELGPRGYKYLPSASQYMLAATRRALTDSGADLVGVEPEARGAAIGTNCAASALHGDMDRTVLATGAGDLSPALAPYFSINLFGSRLAMEHELKGFNLTFTSPRIAGLEAMQYGLRSVRLGRASWLVAGAAEESLDQVEPGADGSEAGAVAVVLEPEDTVTRRAEGRCYGRCQAWTGFLPPSQAGPERAGPDRAAGLVAMARRAFGLPPDARPQVRAVLDDSPVGAAISRALGLDARGSDADGLAAGAGCLRPMLELARALTDPPGDSPDGRLVVTAAAEGNVAFALVTR